MHGEEGQRWEHHQQHHRRVRGVSGPTAGQEGAELRGIHVILLQFRQNTVLHKVEKKTCFYNERSAPPFLMAAVFAMQKSASCNSPLATRTKNHLNLFDLKWRHLQTCYEGNAGKMRMEVSNSYILQVFPLNLRKGDRMG